jgi:hypothetical protein
MMEWHIALSEILLVLALDIYETDDPITNWTGQHNEQP